MSKYFLSLDFAVGQVLSISGYDLQNGEMPCKQKYCIKNMAVKIPNLILLRFCLLVCQHKDIDETEKQVNKDFHSICDWFVDNKVSIHFGDGKTFCD